MDWFVFMCVNIYIVNTKPQEVAMTAKQRLLQRNKENKKETKQIESTTNEKAMNETVNAKNAVNEALSVKYSVLYAYCVVYTVHMYTVHSRAFCKGHLPN